VKREPEIRCTALPAGGPPTGSPWGDKKPRTMVSVERSVGDRGGLEGGAEPGVTRHDRGGQVSGAGMGLHSSTSHLTLSRFGH